MAAIEDLVMTARGAGAPQNRWSEVQHRRTPARAAVTGRIGRLDIDRLVFAEADRTAGDKCGSGGTPTKSNLRVSHGRETTVNVQGASWPTSCACYATVSALMARLRPAQVSWQTGTAALRLKEGKKRHPPHVRAGRPVRHWSETVLAA
jgi:hypothetical protein